MTRIILLALILSVSPLTFKAQNVDNITKKIIGVWTQVKCVRTFDNKTFPLDVKKLNERYEFKSNGTFELHWDDPKIPLVDYQIGKWKITDNGKKIFLFDIKEVPGDPGSATADHYVPIIKMTSTEFVTIHNGEGTKDVITYKKN